MEETNILELPDEILETIFHQLYTIDVQQNLGKVCKRFLKISRIPGMVKDFSFTIKNMKDTEEIEECLAKAQNVIKLFPESKLELICKQFGSPFTPFDDQRLEPFIPFLKKLTIQTWKFEENG